MSQHHSGQANHTNQLQCIAFVALHCILVHHIPFHGIHYSILWLCDFCCIAKDLNPPYCISFVPLHFHCSRALCSTYTVYTTQFYSCFNLHPWSVELGSLSVSMFRHFNFDRFSCAFSGNDVCRFQFYLCVIV